MRESDDVVVRAFLLQHQPHGAHVVAGKPPVAVRIEIAEAERRHESEFDPRDTDGDYEPSCPVMPLMSRRLAMMIV